ncbi:uncharacterized protein LOC122501826 [Leptopilina heterotoma]|uniref:uncharacterized protein LOC122501826 n=1 Tax=Leptopilina heterotoma TaxID=63436 RepID=UPI001CA9CC3D|nr:uncharacterized protein LOC122501826 [Leptopilina heterotoma]
MSNLESFDLQSLQMVLGLIERNITDIPSFLLAKAVDIENAQNSSFQSGHRGAQIIMSEWVDAPLRDGVKNWPLDASSFYLRDAPYDGAIWHQEYRWSWDLRKYETRTYWAPKEFLYPASCKYPMEEIMEKIVGVLGVSTIELPFILLPGVPPREGYRPKNKAVELIFEQKYQLEWEIPGLTQYNWDLRWNVNLRSAWFPC